MCGAALPLEVHAGLLPPGPRGSGLRRPQPPLSCAGLPGPGPAPPPCALSSGALSAGSRVVRGCLLPRQRQPPPPAPAAVVSHRRSEHSSDSACAALRLRGSEPGEGAAPPRHPSPGPSGDLDSTTPQPAQTWLRECGRLHGLALPLAALQASGTGEFLLPRDSLELELVKHQGVRPVSNILLKAHACVWP